MSPNLSAFLAVIRACEGTAGPNGYRTLFGGTLFNSYDEHPRIKVTASGYTSTAAGAYQILASSWDDYRAKTGAGKSFTPEAQDAYAVWAIRDKRKALDDVEAGRLEEAIAKCAKEWASLPGSPYGQPTRTLDYCRRVYRDAGGMPDTVGATKPTVDPTVPESNRKAGMDPLTLVSMLSGVFAPLLRSKLDKALGSDVGKPLADNLLALASTATGRTDPLEAVAVARQDPAIIAKLQVAAEDWLSQMAPILDKAMQYDQALWAAQQSGRESAAKVAQGERWDMTPYLVAFAGAATTACSITLLGAIVYQSVAKTIDPVLLGLAGPLLAITFAAWKSIFDYRFDGTKESSAQTKAITEAVRQRGGV